MSILTCDLCGKRGAYPNFILSHGIGMHVGCMAKENQRLAKEVQDWRDALAMLIQALPQPFKSVVCAHLSKIPIIWNDLSAKDQQQAEKVLAEWSKEVAS